MKILEFYETLKALDIKDCVNILHLTVYNEDLEHPENSNYKITYIDSDNKMKEANYVLDKNEKTGVLLPILKSINTIDV
jgi:hypothetical protein